MEYADLLDDFSDEEAIVPPPAASSSSAGVLGGGPPLPPTARPVGETGRRSVGESGLAVDVGKNSVVNETAPKLETAALAARGQAKKILAKPNSPRSIKRTPRSSSSSSDSSGGSEEDDDLDTSDSEFGGKSSPDSSPAAKRQKVRSAGAGPGRSEVAASSSSVVLLQQPRPGPGAAVDSTTGAVASFSSSDERTAANGPSAQVAAPGGKKHAVEQCSVAETPVARPREEPAAPALSTSTVLSPESKFWHVKKRMAEMQGGTFDIEAEKQKLAEEKRKLQPPLLSDGGGRRKKGKGKQTGRMVGGAGGDNCGKEGGGSASQRGKEAQGRSRSLMAVKTTDGHAATRAAEGSSSAAKAPAPAKVIIPDILPTRYVERFSGLIIEDREISAHKMEKLMQNKKPITTSQLSPSREDDDTDYVVFGCVFAIHDLFKRTAKSGNQYEKIATFAHFL